MNDKNFVYFLFIIAILIWAFNPILLVLLWGSYLFLIFLYPNFNKIIKDIFEDALKSYNIGSTKDTKEILSDI